ncbi:MAG: hypothetical protein M3R51_01540 [Candidatus Eremiobacteraeota bacterium]|nr:hypothetical protein [Candidatus Eremiobacteraeota bacterium]
MNLYARSALLGATTGLRTSAGPFAANWIASGELPAKNALALGGEMLTDKMPFVGNRTSFPQLIARAGSAAYSAKTAAGSRSNGVVLVVAAGAAIGAAFLGCNLRKTLANRLGLPQQVVGIVEDAIVVALVYAASKTR